MHTKWKQLRSFIKTVLDFVKLASYSDRLQDMLYEAYYFTYVNRWSQVRACTHVPVVCIKAVVVFALVLVILQVSAAYLCVHSSVSSILRCTSVAVPGVYPLSTVRLGKGIGLRLNLL